MQYTNPDTRPLPDGWMQNYNSTYQTWYYVDLRRNPPTSTYQHPLDIYPPFQPQPAYFPTTPSFPATQSNGQPYPYPSGGPAISNYAPLTSPPVPQPHPSSTAPVMPAPVNNTMPSTYPASPMTGMMPTPTSHPSPLSNPTGFPPGYGTHPPVDQAPYSSPWNVPHHPHIG